MKKALIILISVGLLNAPATRSYADQAVFDLSVTIPAIPGVNVNVDDTTSEPSLKAGADTEGKLNQEGSQKKLSPLDIIEQKIIEEEGTFVLVTLIER